MKVEINKEGRLLISAENELEQYALEVWCNANIKDCKIDLEHIAITWGDEEKTNDDIE